MTTHKAADPKDVMLNMPPVNRLNHTMQDGMTFVAYRWENKGGAQGGIVSVDSDVARSVQIAPSAVVCPGAVIREGVDIAESATVGPNSYVGKYAEIAHGVTLCANSHIGDYVVTNSGMIICEGSRIFVEGAIPTWDRTK